MPAWNNAAAVCKLACVVAVSFGNCCCNAANFAAYSQPQLIAGASPDARYLFDAVYDHNAQCFVLTLLDVNETFGFVENETRLYPTSRAELLRLIADFQAAPAAQFASE